MRFDWPAGATARVTAHRVVGRASLDPLEADASWRLGVEAAPKDGSRIVTRRLTVDLGPSRMPEGTVDNALIVQMCDPAFAVEESGAFAGLDDAGGTIEMLRSVFEQEVSAVAGASPARRLADRLFQPQALATVAAMRWLSTVEGFIGKRLDIGSWAARQSMAQGALGGEVTFDTEVRALARMPCFEGDDERCVWIDMDATADPAALQEAMDNARQPGLPSTRIESMRTEVDLVLEEASLLPHRVHHHSVRQLTAGGRTFEQTEDKTWLYSWKLGTIR